MKIRETSVQRRRQSQLETAHTSVFSQFHRLAINRLARTGLIRPITLLSSRESKLSLADDAWWDAVDDLLLSVVGGAFSTLEGQRTNPEPSALHVAGIAIARYEPILGKVPHYFWPSPEIWNEVLGKNDGTVTLDIARHFANLQNDAKSGFSRVPTRSYRPAGTIDILEHLVLLSPEEGEWEKEYAGVRFVKPEALVIEDLANCGLVSSEGRQNYRDERGCILFPFTSHDGRLIGEGVVLYGHALGHTEVDNNILEREVALWNEVFSSTFVSLLGNLNSALLALIDPFFLARTREVRRQLAAPAERRETERNEAIEDLLILNKSAVYELLDDLIENRSISVAFFDIDGFKSVNQKIGHQRADQLLSFVGRRLARLMSPARDQWIGRFGGDEFVGIFGSEVSPKDMSDLIREAFDQGLQDFLRQPLPSEDFSELKLTTSLGWAKSSDLETIDDALVPTERKRLLRSMRPAYQLVELADSEVQAYVKALGKNAWLDFETRRSLTEKAYENLPMWIGAINWFAPTDERRVGLNIDFRPIDFMNKMAAE